MQMYIYIFPTPYTRHGMDWLKKINKQKNETTKAFVIMVMRLLGLASSCFLWHIGKGSGCQVGLDVGPVADSRYLVVVLSY